MRIANKALLTLIIGTLALLPFQVGPGAQRSTRKHHKDPPGVRRSPNGNIMPARYKAPVRGLAFHICTCSVPCPCMFRDKDIAGCNIVRVYHITDGGYVGRQIEGLTVVIVPRPEPAAKPDPKAGPATEPPAGSAPTALQDPTRVNAAIYCPKGLSKQTQDDLVGAIFENYMAIGMMKSETYYEPIEFKAVRGGYDIRIPGILNLKTRPVIGVDGQQMTADHLNGEGSRWQIGKSVSQTYRNPNDKDWTWDLVNTNGSWTHFKWFWYDRP